MNRMLRRAGVAYLASCELVNICALLMRRREATAESAGSKQYRLKMLVLNHTTTLPRFDWQCNMLTAWTTAMDDWLGRNIADLASPLPRSWVAS